jgi:hypothetical protein
MNNLIPAATLAALVALSVAACGSRPPHGPGPYGSGNPTAPKVVIDASGNIQLDQEILIFPPNVKGPVTWSLPASGVYRFAPNGIVIEGRLLDQMIRGKPPSVALDPDQKEIVDCKGSQDGLQFTCNNLHPMPGVYKYTIRVRSGERVIERDPSWVNM